MVEANFVPCEALLNSGKPLQKLLSKKIHMIATLKTVLTAHSAFGLRRRSQVKGFITALGLLRPAKWKLIGKDVYGDNQFQFFFDGIKAFDSTIQCDVDFNLLKPQEARIKLGAGSEGKEMHGSSTV
jgi:hypothetical protein